MISVVDNLKSVIVKPFGSYGTKIKPIKNRRPHEGWVYLKFYFLDIGPRLT